MALATHSQLSTLGADFSPQSQLDVAWRATALAFSGPPSSAAPRLEGASQCAETFLRTIKAVGLKSPHAARRVALSCERLRLPRVFSKMGPSAKLKILRKAGTPLSTVNSFFRSASQLNTLRGVRLCYSSFASAVRLYFSFCEIKSIRPFPVRESTVLQWSSLFKPGNTYSSYVNYLRKACFYLGEPIDWLTPAVTNVIKSLRLAGKTTFRFPNFWTAPQC